MFNSQYIVCIDFDGVIVSEKNQFKSESIIDNSLISGVKEALEELDKEFCITIFSVRANRPEGVFAIKEFMSKNSIPFDQVTPKKVPAVLYIDNRGYHFDGDWPKAVMAAKAALRKEIKPTNG